MNSELSKKLWFFLVEPSADITNSADHHNARLLASLFVTLLPLGLVVVSLYPLFMPDETVFLDLDVVGLSIAFLFFFLAYGLTRQGRYQLALGLSATIASVVIFVISPGESDIQDLRYLLMPVILFSLLMPAWVTSLFVAVNLVALLIIPTVVYDVSFLTVLVQPVSFFLIGSVLVIIAANHREKLGRERESKILQTAEALRQSETGLQESLQEKEMLLKEIHHRVKNNMQIVSSLLSLQSGYVQDPQALQIFRESQNRVYSMALIHEKLYRSDNLAQIDLSDYVRDIAHSLVLSYSNVSSGIQLNFDTEQVILGIDAAVPCGLILNELISNALKHAFPDKQSGEIKISLHNAAQQIHLQVADTGIGFPPDLDFQHTTSLGLILVNNLVKQLNGSIALQNHKGVVFDIDFPQILN